MYNPAHQLVQKNLLFFCDVIQDGGLSCCDYVEQLIPPLAGMLLAKAKVERRLIVVEELESVVSANLACGQRLRQSILK